VAALASAAGLLMPTALAVHRIHVPALGPRGDRAAGGAGSAVGVLLACAAALTWVVNPYAAALLVPAAHAWLLAGDGASRLRPPAALGLVAIGLLPLLALLLHDASALGLGPADGAWLAVLLAAGGHLGLGAAVLLALLAACLVRTVGVLRARGRLERIDATTARTAGPAPPPRVYGPGTYAGPGSLGGTKSALRR